MIVSFLPVERLDDLVAATGFKLDRVDAEYKFRWLLERIGMLRERAAMADILHDNPSKADLEAVIQAERRWSAGLSNTIGALQAELESLRIRGRKNSDA